MPYVHIHWFEGRSDEQKREIAEKITEAISEIGKTPRDHVWIRFDDMKRSDFTIAGEPQD
jgi:4-oxalocrotonate tautomerase